MFLNYNKIINIVIKKKKKNRPNSNLKYFFSYKNYILHKCSIAHIIYKFS